MKRRSLFKLLAGVTAAAAMEVCGLLPTRKAEVVFDPAFRHGGDVSTHWITIFHPKVFPLGMGNTLQTVQKQPE